MVEGIKGQILAHLKSDQYRPQSPRVLARQLNLEEESVYHAFRDALRDLMHVGRVVAGARGTIMLPSYPEEGTPAQGVITEVLGEAGEKDVDLKSVIVQFNLPGPFPDPVRDQARHALDTFNPDEERARRIDLSDQVVCTIDPDDAK